MNAEELVDVNLDTKARRRRMWRRLLRVVIPLNGANFSKAELKFRIGAFKGNSNGVNHCRKN